MKNRFSPTFSASEIFSSVPRLGVICPLSILERYERETFERDCNWLWVIERDSRNWRIRCPMFSTVCWLMSFSEAGSATSSSAGGDGGIMNSRR